MPDYKNAKIYCIRSHKTDKIYIGSTTLPLCKRMTCHIIDYKRWLKGKHNYATSYEIIKLGDAYIELLETYSCSCKEELHKKEGGYIRKMKCVNKYIPGRKQKERNEKYRKMNKDKIKQKQIEYRKRNKERINKNAREYRKRNKERINKNARERRANKKLEKMLSTDQ